MLCQPLVYLLQSCRYFLPHLFWFKALSISPANLHPKMDFPHHDRWITSGPRLPRVSKVLPWFKPPSFGEGTSPGASYGFRCFQSLPPLLGGLRKTLPVLLDFLHSSKGSDTSLDQPQTFCCNIISTDMKEQEWIVVRRLYKSFQCCSDVPILGPKESAKCPGKRAVLFYLCAFITYSRELPMTINGCCFFFGLIFQQVLLQQDILSNLGKTAGIAFSSISFCASSTAPRALCLFCKCILEDKKWFLLQLHIFHARNRYHCRYHSRRHRRMNEHCSHHCL